MLFDIPKIENSIIKVLGVGGGGSNAVTHMFEQGIKGVDFAICNTDAQAMESSTVPIKIQLGPELTEGMGAGAQPEVGKQSCIESIDEVRKFLTPGTKMLFITAGMGGGTGTGAAPIIAKAARELDILTVAIVTLPFDFEGKTRTGHAQQGIEQLRKNVDSLLIINNEKLLEIFQDMTLEDAFEEADTVLTIAAKGIAEIITVQGLVNVDFKDVNTVMRNSGVAIMGSALADGEGRARKAIKAAINSPLLEDNDIRGAKHILLNIYYGQQKVTMKEMQEITTYVSEEAGPETNVIWGHGLDERLGNKLNITLIATGFEKDAERNKIVIPKKEVKRIGLDDEKRTAYKEETTELEKPILYDLVDDVNEPIEQDVDDIRSTIENYNGRGEGIDLGYNPNNEKQIEMAEKRKRYMEQQNARREYLRSNNSKPLDDPSTISEMENVPAYKRRRVELDDNLNVEDTDTSNTRLSIDDGGGLGYSKNSFLHDNVD